MTSIGPKKLFKLPSLKNLSPFPTPSTDKITYPSLNTSLHSLKTTHFQSPNTSSPPLQPPLQTFISPHLSSINQSISPPFPLPSVTQSRPPDSPPKTYSTIRIHTTQSQKICSFQIIFQLYFISLYLNPL